MGRSITSMWWKMTYKYIRNIELTITTENGSYDFSKFQVSFQVLHACISTPKILKCRISNLSHGGKGTSNTIGVLQHAKNKKVTLKTWYNGQSPSILFEGDIRMIYAGRSSPVETYLEIEAVALGNDYANSFSSLALSKGWTYDSAVKNTIGNVKGMNIGTIPQKSGSGARAKIIYGNNRDIIRQHARNLSGYPVIADDGTFNILNAQKPQNLGTTLTLTPFNGIIGTPMQVPEGIQLTALLDANYKVGTYINVYSMNGDDSRVAIQQEETELHYTGINNGNQFVDKWGNLQVKGLSHNGHYSIIFVDHVGEMRGEPWYSTIIAQAVDPSDQSIATSRGISALP